MSGDITPIHLKEVADRIGNEWMTLGVNLGIPYHTLLNISSPAQCGPTQYGARMMNHWYQNNARLTPPEVQRRFMEALEEAGRMDLSREVKNSPMNNVGDVERVFQSISPSLTREWRDVGIYLDMGFSELDAIKAPQALDNDPRREMLEIWYKKTRSDRRRILINALEDLKRLDIINEIGGPGTAPRNPAPVSTGTSDFFPSIPTSQPASVNPQQQAIVGGAQRMEVQNPHPPPAQVESLVQHHSVLAWPAGTPQQTHFEDASFQSYRQPGSVETSLQHQLAQAARNGNPAQPRPDLTSIDTHSVGGDHSVDGRTIVQPTDAYTAQSLNTYHDPSM